MSYSGIGQQAEDNAKLLIRLMKEHGALDLGATANFFEVSHEWCCPSCHRTKSEQARLDKNGNLLAAIHNHHDHMGDGAYDCIPSIPHGSVEWRDRLGYDSLRSNFRRFPDTLICNDCNVVEGAAKKVCGAPEKFSFTPFEISTFIIVENNRAHRIDAERLLFTWSKVEPSLEAYRGELRHINRFNKNPEGFESVGGAAWRVLKDVREKMLQNAAKE